VLIPVITIPMLVLVKGTIPDTVLPSSLLLEPSPATAEGHDDYPAMHDGRPAESSNTLEIHLVPGSLPWNVTRIYWYNTRRGTQKFMRGRRTRIHGNINRG
jgi:hypothetical protein